MIRCPPPPDSSPSPPSSSSAEESSSQFPSPPAVPIRRSNRSTLRVLPVRHLDYVTYIVDLVPIPTRFSQARGNPHWDAAMATKFDALHANETWDFLACPPPEVPVIGSVWVYTLKMLPDGTIERYRARVVAHGFCQEYGIDF
ncbi:unnamed protein product [Linum trigynum]|uniref:Reverse transcriptase Ty1/copia-type domain-containing protein n=1 Tax=Linum trigynum TaxID=586398 RepID=A0AAV2E4N2_9ROSI